MPADGVPKWDFLAQPPNDFRDTSAAAVAASGFLELFMYTGAKDLKTLADKTIASLSAAPYLADPVVSDAVLSCVSFLLVL